MENIYALIITLFTGGFVLIGSLLSFLSKNNSKFIHFSISMAFGVMLLLLFLELFPEIFEIFEGKMHFAVIFVFIGVFLIKGLDFLIPEHSHECSGEHDHNENFFHIGIVSIIALIVHQFIEGMAVYVTSVSSLTSGFVLSVGIGLHTIPIGMIVSSTIYKATGSIKKTVMYILSLVIAPFLGGLLVLINQDFFYDEFMIGTLLALTIGMIIYIMIFELLPHIYEYKNKKDTVLGIALGFIIMFISMSF